MRVMLAFEIVPISIAQVESPHNLWPPALVYFSFLFG